METKEILTTVFSTLSIGLAGFISVFLLRKQQNKALKKAKEDEEQNKEEIEQSESSLVLKLPISYRLTPLSLVVMGIFIICVALVQQDSNEYIWGALGFLILPGMTMSVCWSLWKVETIQDGFRYRNWIGITKTYYYADLEYDSAHTGLKWWFIKEGKKVFCMAYYIENENKLLRIYNKYKSKQRAKELKNKKEEKRS